MLNTDRELDRYLTLLRNKIREHGFTQLEVQEALGWGRSYISQLLTKQKALRLEQVLSILDVIGSDPRAFFAELYGGGLAPVSSSWSRQVNMRADDLQHHQQVQQELAPLLNALVKLLRDQEVITDEELGAAVRSVEAEEMESS